MIGMIEADRVRRLAALASWLGLVVIAVLSLVPGDDRPHTFLPGPAEHVLAYALTGMALAIGYPQPRHRVFWFLGMSAAGALFEILQLWDPGRLPSLIDVAACSSGAALGLFFGAFFFRPVVR
jgi:VanZ family protein